MKIGRMTGNVLKRSLLQQIRTKRNEVMIGAGLGEDCAVFGVSDYNLVCIQEGFLNIGITLTHLIRRCANVMAARGGELIAVSLQFLIPADAQEDSLRAFMAEAEDICADLRVQIAGVGGRVAQEVAAPYVMVTGYGAATENRNATEQRIASGHAVMTEDGTAQNLLSDDRENMHTVGAAKAGHDIVLSKWIGLEGTAVLTKKYRKMLQERYPSRLLDEAAGFDRYLSTMPEAELATKNDVNVIYNVSEGGIFAALWELAQGAGVGLTIDLKKIPIRQETVEVCNYCGVNPYELLSGGCLLITCADGEQMVDALAAEGISGTVIGKITDSNDRLILNEDEVRYLDRPAVDGIYHEVSGEL